LVNYILRRIAVLVVLLFFITIIVFVLIQLPPGDYVTVHVMELQAAGQNVQEADIIAFKQLYGLDKTLHEQYFIWMRNIFIRGDFGMSFTFYGQGKSVADLLAERVPLTAAISLLSTLFVYGMAVPIAIYSATHQYSPFDYFWTLVGFIGLATPSFLLALIIMWIAFSKFNITVIGLFSEEFVNAPWTVAKLNDFLKHVWIPVTIIGLSGTAGTIRSLRATLLDELNRQYVITARSKGLSELKLLFKYPVRVAINPTISTIGWMLPTIISGEVLVSMVMNIPTTGPLLLQALLQQDMYLAGSILLILSALTVIGTLLSDILLAWWDPRIRYD